jgi:hypothetical protein
VAQYRAVKYTYDDGPKKMDDGEYGYHTGPGVPDFIDTHVGRYHLKDNQPEGDVYHYTYSEESGDE